MEPPAAALRSGFFHCLFDQPANARDPLGYGSLPRSTLQWSEAYFNSGVPLVHNPFWCIFERPAAGRRVRASQRLPAGYRCPLGPTGSGPASNGAAHSWSFQAKAFGFQGVFSTSAGGHYSEWCPDPILSAT